MRSLNSICIIHRLSLILGTRETAHQLRALAAIPKDSGSIPSIYIMAKNCLYLHYTRRSHDPLWPLQAPGMHRVYRVTFSQNICAHKIINTNIFKIIYACMIWIRASLECSMTTVCHGKYWCKNITRLHIHKN